MNPETKQGTLKRKVVLAIIIEIDVSHADAQTMYNKARKEIVNAPLGSPVIGTK